MRPDVGTFRGPGDGRGGQLLEVAPARNAPPVELMRIMVTRLAGRAAGSVQAIAWSYNVPSEVAGAHSPQGRVMKNLRLNELLAPLSNPPTPKPN